MAGALSFAWARRPVIDVAPPNPHRMPPRRLLPPRGVGGGATMSAKDEFAWMGGGRRMGKDASCTSDELDRKEPTDARPSSHGSSEAMVRMGGGRKVELCVLAESTASDTSIGVGGGGMHALALALASAGSERARANGEFAPWKELCRNSDELRPAEWNERTRLIRRAEECGSSSSEASSKEEPIGEANGGGRGKSGMRRPADPGWRDRGELPWTSEGDERSAHPVLSSESARTTQRRRSTADVACDGEFTSSEGEAIGSVLGK